MRAELATVGEHDWHVAVLKHGGFAVTYIKNGYTLGLFDGVGGVRASGQHYRHQDGKNE